MAAQGRKSRFRVFPSDLIVAFWFGFGTCGALVLFVLWVVSRNG
jgi:hypothetical protein